MSSAQVIQLFRGAAFDSQGLETLCAAYDRATASLHDRDTRPTVVNEIIAQRIINLAETGERNPDALARAVLESFGIEQRR